MKNLIVLPVLDGSKEAAIARLEAWSTRPHRSWLAQDVARYGTIGSRRDTLDRLGVER